MIASTRRPRTVDDIARDVVAATNAGAHSVHVHALDDTQKDTLDGGLFARVDRDPRVFAWLHNRRRVVTQWEYRAEDFLGLLQLACARILLRI